MASDEARKLAKAFIDGDCRCRVGMVQAWGDCEDCIAKVVDPILAERDAALKRAEEAEQEAYWQRERAGDHDSARQAEKEHAAFLGDRIAALEARLREAREIIDTWQMYAKEWIESGEPQTDHDRFMARFAERAHKWLEEK